MGNEVSDGLVRDIQQTIFDFINDFKTLETIRGVNRITCKNLDEYLSNQKNVAVWAQTEQIAHLRTNVKLLVLGVNLARAKIGIDTTAERQRRTTPRTPMVKTHKCFTTYLKDLEENAFAKHRVSSIMKSLETVTCYVSSEYGDHRNPFSMILSTVPQSITPTDDWLFEIAIRFRLDPSEDDNVVVEFSNTPGNWRTCYVYFYKVNARNKFTSHDPNVGQDYSYNYAGEENSPTYMRVQPFVYDASETKDYRVTFTISHSFVMTVRVDQYNLLGLKEKSTIENTPNPLNFGTRMTDFHAVNFYSKHAIPEVKYSLNLAKFK